MEATLEAVKRNVGKSSEAGRLRRAGQLPAVVYGSDSKEGVAVSVDPKSLLRILHSKSGVNTLISLKVDGGGDTRVLVKEYQLDPVSHRLMHADFYKIAMDKTIRITVQVHLTGEAKGVKQQGGVVDFVNREVDIEVLPADIPEHITVDVTELMVGQGVRVRDIPAGKWKAITDSDLLLVHVILPKVEAAPAADAAAAPGAAEPEVAKKGKVDKDADAKDEKADAKKK